MVLLYALSYRQDNTYHGLSYTTWGLGNRERDRQSERRKNERGKRYIKTYREADRLIGSSILNVVLCIPHNPLITEITSYMLLCICVFVCTSVLKDRHKGIYRQTYTQTFIHMDSTLLCSLYTSYWNYSIHTSKCIFLHSKTDTQTDTQTYKHTDIQTHAQY